ncbi:hypothetical protein [Chromobacterium violaceum]|nr:hypothetical protein [Chromobacterium violaceum]
MIESVLLLVSGLPGSGKRTPARLPIRRGIRRMRAFPQWESFAYSMC